MAGLVFRSFLVWLVILGTAIASAVVREIVLVPVMGADLALPVGGLLLTALICLIAFLCLPFFPEKGSRPYIVIGVIWFLLTLSFEFLLGHFVMGQPWHEILQVFDVSAGNLFVVALLATLVSPWLSARVRGKL